MKLIIIAVAIVAIIAGCGGGGNPVMPDNHKYINYKGETVISYPGFGLNEKGAIIVYPGDYIHILNYRCKECHKVEHRDNP